MLSSPTEALAGFLMPFITAWTGVTMKALIGFLTLLTLSPTLVESACFV